MTKFTHLSAYPEGLIAEVAEDEASESESSFHELDASVEDFKSLANNPAFAFWNDPAENIYED